MPHRIDRVTNSSYAPWHYAETGSGEPLILLHGIGMSHAAWKAVTPYLQLTRRVIAFDIAGFGLTPPLPRSTPPTISNLVDGLCRSLRAIDIEMPVDIAGNSLGGCMALEAARRGMARTVVAISPIGLWTNGPAPHVRYVFRSLRWLATRSPALLKLPMRNGLTRELALAVPLSVGSRRMPVNDALRCIDDLAGSTAFDETFESTLSRFSGLDIGVPVTVAFGNRDWILTKRSRHRHALPAHTQWVTKHGWGHVPMWADPRGVSDAILRDAGPSGDRRAVRGGDRIEAGEARLTVTSR
jgi:pimeloyl-ACP methyl ester carboxylesterase